MHLVNSATLDTFRYEVFRARLPLVVLLILLSPGAVPADAEQSSTLSMRLPRPSLGLLLHPNVLPFVAPCAVLWIARLLGMALEDRLAKHDMTTARQGASVSSHWKLLSQVSALATVCVLSCLPWTLAQLRLWALVISDTPGAKTASTLLPLHALIYLELSTALFSFIAILPKLSPLLPGVPLTISLPSPSHAPTMTDVIAVVRSFMPPSRHAVKRRGPAAATASPFARRHGALPGMIPPEPAPQQPTNFHLAEPLRMPAVPADAASSTSDAATQSPLTRPKAPRLKGLRVRVETAWCIDALLSLWGRAAGVASYTLVIMSLPTLSPTSLAPIVALLSLRAELGAFASTWSAARGRVECLEFVRRRWGDTTAPATPQGADVHAGRPDEATSTLDAPPTCSICFESVRPDALDTSPSAFKGSIFEAGAPASACRLDCGHELHAGCLVMWLATQAFCPLCHDRLSATPPGFRTQPSTPTGVEGGGNVGAGAPAVAETT